MLSLSIWNGRLTARLDPQVPAIQSLSLDGTEMDAHCELSCFRIGGVERAFTVTSVRDDDDKVVYGLSFEGLEATLDVEMSVAGNALTYRLTTIVDPLDELTTIEIPGLSLVTVDRALAATPSVDRAVSGDIEVGPGDEGSAWMIVGDNGVLAAGFETNASSEDDVYARFSYRPCGNRIGIGPATWTYKPEVIRHYPGGIGPGPDPFITIAIAGDVNGDGTVDWQDGAIATRMVRQQVIGADEVAKRVITRIPLNIVSQATHPFLATLEATKRFALATDGLGQQVLLKGYQCEGHDSAQGDYARYNEGAGGLEDLRTLVSAGRTWNATFGVHVNATEAYSESECFEEAVDLPPRKGWGWMNQAWKMASGDDLASGNLTRRLEKLRADFPADSNLNWLYWDVYYPRGWEADRFSSEVATMGWRQGSEWSNALIAHSTWSHWAVDESYGATTNKGINSRLIRFVENSARDAWNPHPLLGGARVAECEGWEGGHDVEAFLRAVWEHNLPTKFLQTSPITGWDEDGIRFANGTVVTPWGEDALGGVPTHRQITVDGVVVYEGGAYLLPWHDGPDRLYYWNPTGVARTWQLTDQWAPAPHLWLYELTDTGRAEVAMLDVVDGEVSLPEVRPGTAYVLTSEPASSPDPHWGSEGIVANPHFYSGDLTGFQASGGVSVEKVCGRYVASLGSGPASIAQDIEVTGPCRLVAWIEIEEGMTRPVAVRLGSETVELDATSAKNHVTSSDWHGTYFQPVSVIASDPDSFTIEAGEGEASVRVTDLRVVHLASLPGQVEDFENAFGYGPFLTGSASDEDGRTQLTYDNPPYSKAGWYGLTENSPDVAVAGQKYVDNVLSGSHSLMCYEEKEGEVLRTGNTLGLRPGERYRVSFDYQASYDDYELVIGADQPDAGQWTSVIRERHTLAAARGTGWSDGDEVGTGTARARIEFTAEDHTYIAICRHSQKVQGCLVIDQFQIEQIKP